MTGFLSRFLQRTGLNKRLISQATTKDADKSSLVTRLLQRFRLGKRDLSVTPVLKAKQMPSCEDLATGIEKRLMLLYKAGVKDPYHLSSAMKAGVGTYECPTMIPSAFEGRIIGCICLDDRFVKYMWLEKGCPKRCECGHYYKLKEVPPI